MKETRKTIGFRLDSSHCDLLESRAKICGITPGELAREIVVESLSDSRELDRLRLKVSAIETEVIDLRRDLALSVQALLAASGRVTTEQAQEWVRLNLKGAE